VQNAFFIQSHEYEKRLTAKLNVLAAFMRISNVHCADLSNWRIVMSIFGDALSFAEHVGGSMVNDTAHPRTVISLPPTATIANKRGTPRSTTSKRLQTLARPPFAVSMGQKTSSDR